MQAHTWWGWALVIPFFGLFWWGIAWMASSAARQFYEYMRQQDTLRAWNSVYRKLSRNREHPHYYLVYEADFQEGSTDEAKRRVLGSAIPPVRIVPLYQTFAVLVIAYVVGAVMVGLLALIFG